MRSTSPASRSPTAGRSTSSTTGRQTDTQEAAFLHEVHAGACQYFTTVLGPGADVFHYNHIHLDLANHGSTDTGPRRICKPTPAPDLLPAPQPRDGLPPAPDIEEPLDIAHLSAPGAVAAPPDAAPDRVTDPTAPCRRRRWARAIPRRRSCRPAPVQASTRARPPRSATTTTRPRGEIGGGDRMSPGPWSREPKSPIAALKRS